MTPEEETLQEEIVALTRTFGPRVYAIACRYARTRADTEDLLQEIWTRVIEAYPRKSCDAPAGGWLTLLAVNVSLNWSRDRYRWTDFKERALQFFAIELEILQDGKNEPELEHPAEDWIWRAIESLPPLQRDVVVLRLFEGMSTEEAAHAIERTEGTIKASLHRGIRSLRKKLADLEDLWANDDL